MKEYSSQASSFIFPKLLQPLGAREISAFNPLNLFPGGIPDYIAPKKINYSSKPFFHENRSFKMPTVSEENEKRDRPQQITHFSQASVVNLKSNISANLPLHLSADNSIDRVTNHSPNIEPQLDNYSHLNRHTKISATNIEPSAVEEADVLASNNESVVNNHDLTDIPEIKRAVVEPDIAPQLKISDVSLNESSPTKSQLDSKPNIEVDNLEYARQSNIKPDITSQSTVYEVQNLDNSNLPSNTVKNISLDENSTIAPKLEDHSNITDAIDEQQSTGDREKITPELNNKYSVETENRLSLPHTQQPVISQEIITSELNNSTQDRLITPKLDIVSDIDNNEAASTHGVLSSNSENISELNDRIEEIQQPTISQEVVISKSNIISDIDNITASHESESNDELKATVSQPEGISELVLPEAQIIAPNLNSDSDRAFTDTTEVARENTSSELSDRSNPNNSDRIEETQQPISQDITPELNISTEDRVITPKSDLVSNVELDEANIASDIPPSDSEDISERVLDNGNQTIAPKLGSDSERSSEDTIKALQEDITSEFNYGANSDNSDRIEDIPQPTISQEIITPKSNIISDIDNTTASHESESNVTVFQPESISNRISSNRDRAIAPKLGSDSDEVYADTIEAIESKTSELDNNSDTNNSDRIEETQQPMSQDITPELNTSTQDRVVAPKSDIVPNIKPDEVNITSKIPPSDSEDIPNGISPKNQGDSNKDDAGTNEIVEDGTSKLNNFNIDNSDRLESFEIQQSSKSQEIIAPQLVNVADSNAEGEPISQSDSVNKIFFKDSNKIPSQPNTKIASEISHNSNRDRQDTKALQLSTEKEIVLDVDNALDSASSDESAISTSNKTPIDLPDVQQTVALNNGADFRDRQNFSEAKESIVNRATITSHSIKKSPDISHQEDEPAPLLDNTKLESDRLDSTAKSNLDNVSVLNPKEQQITPQSVEPTTVVYSRKINPVVVHSSLNNKAIAPKIKPITSINSSLIFLNKGQQTELRDNSLINPKSLPLFLQDNPSSKKPKNKTKHNLAAKTALAQRSNTENNRDNYSDLHRDRDSYAIPNSWSSLNDLVSQSSIDQKVRTKSIKTKVNNNHNQINLKQNKNKSHNLLAKDDRVSRDNSATVRLSVERSSDSGYQYQTINPQIARSHGPPPLLPKVENIEPLQPEINTTDNQNDIDSDDEEEQLDILATEIYDLLQHRLTIERERFGQYYR